MALTVNLFGQNDDGENVYHILQTKTVTRPDGSQFEVKNERYWTQEKIDEKIANLQTKINQLNAIKAKIGV